ncbi:hypothetical protein GQ457_09G031260 [Hibiscus cannabinus]
MASSSPPPFSSSSQMKHQVFLSFRGEDTRHNFTTHLLQALKLKGLDVFFDEEKLERGEELSPALSQAIAASNLSVIVLSPDYASSKSCLAELSDIMDRKINEQHTVLPLFYHVDPSDVQNLGGIFKAPFDEHESKGSDQVQLWKAAFTEVGKLKGWHIEGDKFDRPESEHIENIVKYVVLKLTKHQVFLSFRGEDTGLNFTAHLLKALKDRGINVFSDRGEQFSQVISVSNLSIVVLSVNYASSKSCLAELSDIMDQKDNHGQIVLPIFYHVDTSHVRNLGGSFKTSFDDHESKGIDQLQQLKKSFAQVGKLKGWHIEGGKFDRPETEYIEDIVEYVTKKLMNSMRRSVSKELVGIEDQKEIILRLIRREDIRVIGLWGMGGIGKTTLADALNPPVDFLDLSYKLVEYARGSPLALKVLGSKLHTKSRKEWESEVDTLNECGQPQISQFLKSSFDELREQEKNIFLDIAIFFKGEPKENVEKILSSCYKGALCGISNLVDKCLLDITSFPFSLRDMLEIRSRLRMKNAEELASYSYMGTLDDGLSNFLDKVPQCISMHDMLEEMCKDIVLKESKPRSRLWSSKDVSQVLKYNKGTDSTEGMKLDMFEIDKLQLRPTVFEKMLNLRYINFYFSSFSGTSRNRKLHADDVDDVFLPEELRLLCWEHYPFKSLSNFNPKNLVVLKLPHGDMERLWTDDDHWDLANLRKVVLSDCKKLTKIPNLLSATNLEVVCFNGSNPTELVEFNPEIEASARRAQGQIRREKKKQKEQSNSERTADSTNEESTDSTNHPNDPTPPIEVPRAPMAEQTIRQLAAAPIAQQPLCITFPQGDTPFQLKTGLIHLLPTFHGLPSESPHRHLNEFHLVCSSMKPQGVSEDQIKLRAFPFSLSGLAKEWLFYLPPNSVTTWTELNNKFLDRFFPAAKASEIRRSILGIKQKHEESLHEYWERYKKLCASCPQHGLGDQTLIQYFYEGLLPMEMKMIDAASGGALCNMTPTQAKDLISTMAANSQQFSAISEPNQRVHEVSIVSLEKKFEQFTDMVASMLADKKQLFRPCGICTSTDHPTDGCPSLQDETVNAVDYKEDKFRGNHKFILFSGDMIKEDKDYEEASFQFYIKNRYYCGDEEDDIKVKKCGVHLSYVDEMGNVPVKRKRTIRKRPRWVPKFK